VLFHNKSLVAALAATGLAVGVAACGGGSSSSTQGSGGATVKIDIGTGKPLVVPKGKPNIGMLIATTANDWTKGYVKGAQEEADRLGVPLKVLSADFDPQKQMNQMQNAIQSKRYNAWLLAPVDGRQECAAATKQAPAANIVVSIFVLPACGRDLKPISDIWAPGTLNMAVGQENIDYKRGFLKGVAALLPGPHKIAFLYGPPLNSSTLTMKKAFSELRKTRPELQAVASINTDFTTPTALAKTQSLLQAHPEIDTIISTYSDITRGAIQAIAAAGKTGKIKVFDQGASKYSVSQVRKGTLIATSEYVATYAGKRSVQVLVDAFNGKSGPRFVDVQRHGSTTDPYLVTKDNVDAYSADY
jgi:ribose transport system substrate-binding protein